MALQSRADFKSGVTSDGALLGPAYDAENVDLSSSDYVPAVAARGFIICGTTGTVELVTPAGNTVTIPSGLSVGVEHAIGFTKIMKIGTTATSIVALG